MMVREKFYLSIICICTLFTTVHCYAQNILRGTVENEEGQKMEYTTIRLLNTDSTFVAGSITDTIGNYQFNTKTGQYIVVVSAIGYKTQTLPVTIASGITDAPIIKLLNESYVLDGVTITGSSFVRKKDHLPIHPDTKQTKHAHTGYDLLSKLMIPGVDVDIKAGKVKTFGGDVTLYIDGRKVTTEKYKVCAPKMWNGWNITMYQQANMPMMWLQSTTLPANTKPEVILLWMAAKQSVIWEEITMSLPS